MTQEQIKYYSELMAKMDGYQLCDCGHEPKHYKYGSANWAAQKKFNQITYEIKNIIRMV